MADAQRGLMRSVFAFQATTAAPRGLRRSTSCSAQVGVGETLKKTGVRGRNCSPRLNFLTTLYLVTHALHTLRRCSVTASCTAVASLPRRYRFSSPGNLTIPCRPHPVLLKPSYFSCLTLVATLCVFNHTLHALRRCR